MATQSSEPPTFTVRVEVAAGTLKWWTKGYTFFLAALAIANVATDWVAFRHVDGPISVEFVTGHSFAQLFLMSFWLALGGLHFVARFVVVMLLTVAGTLAAWYALDSDVDTFCILAGLGGAIVFGIHALMLPLRWLLGWRADFDSAYHRKSSYGAMQFGLIHLLALTTACALPFAVIQLFPGEEARNWGPYTVILCALVLVVGFPISMIVTTTKRQWAWGLVVAGTFAASGLVKLAINIPWGMWANLAMAATVFLNLGALRLVGLRLFSVKHPVTFGTDLADQDLAKLVASWPTLPEEVRQGIMATIRDVTEPSRPS